MFFGGTTFETTFVRYLGQLSMFISAAASFVSCLIIYLFVICAVDQKEREAERNPEQELADSGFHDYQRP